MTLSNQTISEAEQIVAILEQNAGNKAMKGALLDSINLATAAWTIKALLAIISTPDEKSTNKEDTVDTKRDESAEKI